MTATQQMKEEVIRALLNNIDPHYHTNALKAGIMACANLIGERVIRMVRKESDEIIAGLVLDNPNCKVIEQYSDAFDTRLKELELC